MMTQACSARNIPGAWPDSMARIVVVLLAACVAAPAQTGVALLARGIDRFEHAKYNEAIQDLKTVQPQLPKLADYVAFYLASSRIELKDFTQAHKDLAVFRQPPIASPLSARAALLEARVLTETGTPGDAISLLKEREAELPRPAADFALAQAYEAAKDPGQAATYYQRVYYLYPLSDLAPRGSFLSSAHAAADAGAWKPFAGGSQLHSRAGGIHRTGAQTGRGRKRCGHGAWGRGRFAG
jgi:predicted Zn-dependent protease